jgi:hypothetical protein
MRLPLSPKALSPSSNELRRRLGFVLGDDDAFPERQSVGLDNGGVTVLRLEIADGFPRVVERLVGGGGMP